MVNIQLSLMQKSFKAMQEVTVYSNLANKESRPDGRIGLGAICGLLC